MPIAPKTVMTSSLKKSRGARAFPENIGTLVRLYLEQRKALAQERIEMRN